MPRPTRFVNFFSTSFNQARNGRRIPQGRRSARVARARSEKAVERAGLDLEQAVARVSLVGAAQEAARREAIEEARSGADGQVLRLERLDESRVDWEELETYADRHVFQTREWLAFIAESQQAEPVIAAVRQEGETVGFFTGLVVRRYGLRILGSPFRGWTTSYLGFNLRDGIERRAAVEALLPFAFRSLRCIHLELRDRELTVDDVDGLGFDYSPKTIFEVDLRQSEDDLFAGMTSACRRCIRKAEKIGVRIEEAEDLEFAEDYFDQLREVFAKQSLVPSYDKERVTELIRELHPTGRLLLLRARDPEGRCIATGIFPAMNRWMYFWGGASWRGDQILRPNEALMWYAMRYWRARGIERFDLGGGAGYKRKYGGAEVMVPFFRISRSRAVGAARRLAKGGFRMRQAALGRLTTGRAGS
jgi:CelD/BcsL family acetyltransferase involved in cellulose biosynthesis